MLKPILEFLIEYGPHLCLGGVCLMPMALAIPCEKWIEKHFPGTDS